MSSLTLIVTWVRLQILKIIDAKSFDINMTVITRLIDILNVTVLTFSTKYTSLEHLKKQTIIICQIIVNTHQQLINDISKKYGAKYTYELAIE